MAEDYLKRDTVARLRKLADDVEAGHLLDADFSLRGEHGSRDMGFMTTSRPERVGGFFKAILTINYVDESYIKELNESRDTQ